MAGLRRGDEEETTHIKTLTVNINDFTWRYDGDKSVRFQFCAPASGTVISAFTALHVNDNKMYYRLIWWGMNEDVVATRDKTWTLPGAPGRSLTEGEPAVQGTLLNKNCLSGNPSRCQDYARKMLPWLQGGTDA